MEQPQRNFVAWLERAPLPRFGGRRASRPSQIPPVLSVGKLRCVFQPLIDLQHKRVFAYEALVRSDSEHWKGPPAMFDQAIASQCVGALGRVLREIAVEGCPGFPLFLNIHPHEFDEGWLVQPNDPIFEHAHGVYLEITESVPLSHFALCHSVLREVRHKGAMLAVDDLGAGYSNLKYIADLAPEVVKLDRALVQNLGKEPRLRKLVTSLVRLCTDLGAKVVAEGIEDADEARAAIDTGAHYGQGYFFARPAYPPPLFDPSTL